MCSTRQVFLVGEGWFLQADWNYSHVWLPGAATTRVTDVALALLVSVPFESATSRHWLSHLASDGFFRAGPTEETTGDLYGAPPATFRATVETQDRKRTSLQANEADTLEVLKVTRATCFGRQEQQSTVANFKDSTDIAFCSCTIHHLDCTGSFLRQRFCSRFMMTQSVLCHMR